ncbi:MAG: type I DNA topoisomerase [Erysipelothrix sp.]|nr:type I DNA topoisomerase [Erysipelothrix sp.]
MKKLVIVESPSKSKTIEKYLGADFEVVSSKGHIRDLAIKGKDGLGIDIKNGFAPTYIVDKDKIKTVKELKAKAKKSSEVFLATDPDREGEAISWHLAIELDLDPQTVSRVVFNEITKDAVIAAFDHPRYIDLNLVKSQETRRILDRIIGFKLSKLLQSKIRSKSAGRVQSVALKLIVDREKEIDAFVSTKYWSITAAFNEKKKEFDATLTKISGETAEILSADTAQELLKKCDGPFLLDQLNEKKTKKQPRFPFITSTLQQEMSTKFNFPSKKTMRIAQKLYEGVEVNGQLEGLITYMRTDSTRLSQQFVINAQKLIETSYGKEYVGFYKVKNNADTTQDAHEAIRPTHCEYTPEKMKKFLTPDEWKVYAFIYDRTMASLMAPARNDVVTAIFNKDDLQFTANGSVLAFDGYLKVYGSYEQSKDKELPPLTVGEWYTPIAVESKEHQTQGPSRYTEASLIKEMESNGIGRPSTYSAIIETIQARGYVRLDKGSESGKTKYFFPTDQGKLTDEKLAEHFDDIINVKYTAFMEKELDEIAEGELDNIAALTEFYDKFSTVYDKARQTMEKIAPVLTGDDCPKCGKPLVIRKSRLNEEFVGCMGYPECDYIVPNQQKFTGENCPDCGKPLVERKNRMGKIFIGCSAYPECKYIKKEQPVLTGEMCPLCGAALVQRKSRYGKMFTGCSAFPKCRYIKNDKKAKEENEG